MRIPAAQPCRELARKRLNSQDDRLVELGALQIFENYVASAEPGPVAQRPLTEKPFDAQRPLHALTGYTTGLACAAALSGPVTQALSEFSAPLFWPEQESKGALRTFGSPEQIDEVATRLAPGYTDQEVLVTGNLQPEQREIIAAGLQELKEKVGPQAFSQLKKLHIRSYLGWLGNSGVIAGLAALTTPHSLFLAAPQLASKEGFRDILFHEFGHLRDAQQAGLLDPQYASLGPGSPFGNGGDFDYVSDYARSKPTEDLAETHSHLLRHWDAVQQDPQLWIHANGQLGKKMAWILDEFYERPVPKPGQNLTRVLQQVEKGQTPFADFSEFQEQLQQFLASKPVENRAFFQELAETSRHDQPKPSWWSRLADATNLLR